MTAAAKPADPCFHSGKLHWFGPEWSGIPEYETVAAQCPDCHMHLDRVRGWVSPRVVHIGEVRKPGAKA